MSRNVSKEVGNVLDHWEQLPNDLRSDSAFQALDKALSELYRAVIENPTSWSFTKETVTRYCIAFRGREFCLVPAPKGEDGEWVKFQDFADMVDALQIEKKRISEWLKRVRRGVKPDNE